MNRNRLIRRLQALEELADTRPVADSYERKLEAAIKNDSVLVEILSRVPQGHHAFDVASGQRVRYGPKLAIADIDLDDSETVLLRMEAIRNRLEGNPDDNE